MAGVKLRPVKKGNPLNILLLGKTGHGKSATGNSILEAEVFLSEAGGKSVTQDCQMFGNKVGGRQINVVDTPGTMDTQDPDAAFRVLATAVQHLKNSIDAFIIVLNYSTRMTKEETDTFDRLQKLFGQEVLDFMVVVFTHGDNYADGKKQREDKKSFSEFLQTNGGEYLVKFLRNCKNRYALIDNFAEEDSQREQLIKLVDIIDKMIDENNGKRYKSKYLPIEEETVPATRHEIRNEPIEEEGEEEGEEEEEDEEEEGSCSSETVAGPAYDDNDVETRQDTPTGGSVLPQEQVISAAVTAMSRSGAECFPGDALILVPSVGHVKLKDLAVGDKVATLSNNISPSTTEVYLFGHSLEHCLATFICLKTTNHQLRVSAGHYIHTLTDGQIETKAARDVCVGDTLLTLSQERCVPEQVTAICEMQEAGLYAPFTLEGSILVDGILASCYVDVLPSTVAHSLLWPVRQMYKMSPTTLAVISKSGEDGIPRWIKWCMDKHIKLL